MTSRFGGYYDTFHPELCEICEILLTGGGEHSNPGKFPRITTNG